jgi:hypothetical protein
MPAGADPYDRPVDADSLIIGRASSADVVVEDSALSRQHARIFLQSGELMVEDLGSRNGTIVNDELISGPTPLEVGDEVRLAGSRICIEDDERGSTEPARLKTVTTRPMGGPQELQERWESLEGEAELRSFAERLKILDEAHRALAGSVSSEELLGPRTVPFSAARAAIHPAHRPTNSTHEPCCMRLRTRAKQRWSTTRLAMHDSRTPAVCSTRGFGASWRRLFSRRRVAWASLP